MKRFAPLLQIIWIFVTVVSSAGAQTKNIANDNILLKLKTFTANRPTEKVYLQFDKPLYAVGDTIYFKAYAVSGEKHQLSALSGVLHVDFINTLNKADQSIKLQLQDGIAWGDFALPDSLPAGGYRVRAYTNWMRNEGDESFFDKQIKIASAAPVKIPESGVPGKLSVGKADIQFLPEGGSLVAGIRQKIAFKAVGTNGLGVDVRGTVVDNDNEQVCTFSSSHLGMGYFYLQPEANKTYQASVTYADGAKNTMTLPSAATNGISLSVDNDSVPKAAVKILADKAYLSEHKNQLYTLVIYSGGIATAVSCKLDSQVVCFDILKRRLHTGVATVTLFSPANEPLCERLFFVQNYDKLDLNVSTNKPVYVKREKVELKLGVVNRKGDPAAGHFSVSVVDESNVPEDMQNNDNILSYLLLTSDLKGYVEQPSQYFADTTANSLRNLDILMLTQGYRHFTWKQVLNDDDRPTVYKPEYSLDIAGQVKSLFGKPISNGTVNLFQSKGGGVLTVKTDAEGMFNFSNLIFYDTTRFVLSAVNARAKNTTKISYFKDPLLPVAGIHQFERGSLTINTSMTIYLKNSLDEQAELIKYGIVKRRMLKEVNIKAKKLDDDYRTQSLAGAGFADQVMHADEIERIGGQLSTSLNGRLRGIIFNSQHIAFTETPLGYEPMLIIIDGVEEQAPYSIDNLVATDVETVEVLKNTASESIYGMAGAGGVLVITTKQGGGIDPKNVASIGVLPISVAGFYKAREFYSPKYDAGTANLARDLRSTIFWAPEIKTGANGNANCSYFNADGTGTYRVTIEGIDSDGNIGRQVYRYKVE